MKSDEGSPQATEEAEITNCPTIADVTDGPRGAETAAWTVTASEQHEVLAPAWSGGDEPVWQGWLLLAAPVVAARQLVGQRESAVSTPQMRRTATAREPRETMPAIPSRSRSFSYHPSEWAATSVHGG
jgi:hypothetical protein